MVDLGTRLTGPHQTARRIDYSDRRIRAAQNCSPLKRAAHPGSQLEVSWALNKTERVRKRRITIGL